MAAVSPAPQQHAPRAQLLVSRQPVLDEHDRVVGYRIGYALHDGRATYEASPAETLDLVDEALQVIGAEEYALGSRAYLPVSRETLLHRSDVPPVNPDRVVFRVRYVDALDPGVIAVIARARQRGYSFELAELSRADFDPGILRHFDTVEFHLDKLELTRVATLMPGLSLRGAMGVATGVRTREQRDQAHAIGCKRFMGPFYLTPNVVAGRLVPVANMHTLVRLARLRGTADDLSELIGLIEKDVGLGVRLLRYINSAYFGLLGPVRSVRHAAMMLGAKGLARWALVAACVGSRDQIPREQALVALTRARTCELLGGHRQRSADPDVLFTIGMLSAVDVIFGITLEQLVAELSLASATADALLRHAGPAGEILGSVIAYEHGEFHAAAPDHPLTAHAEAYRTALVWAREAVSNT